MSDPYAAYGGTVAAGGGSAGADPYAAYGGNAGGAAAPAQATAQTAAPAPPHHFYDTAVKEIGDVGKGISTGLSQTGGTAMDLVHSIPGAGAALDKSPGWQQSRQQTAEYANRGADTAGEKAGLTIENLIEFAAGEEGLKGLNLAEKVGKLGSMAKILEAHPAIAKVVGNAVRQGTVGGAQTLAHGGSGTDALLTGAATAATGGVLEGVPEGVKALAEKVAPGSRSIAGVDVPALRPKTDTSAMGKFRAGQQTAAKEAVGNMAQDAAGQAIERLNATRAVEPPPPLIPESRRLPAPADAKPFRFEIPTPTPEETPQTTPAGSRIVPGGDRSKLFTGDKQMGKSEWQYVPPPTDTQTVSQGRAATLMTEDPHLVAATLQRTEEVLGSSRFDTLPARQQQAIQEQAATLRQQLDQANAHKAAQPTFDPVDAKAALQHVSSYGDAEAVLRNITDQGFSRVDQATGGEWGRLRAQEKAARQVLRTGTRDGMKKAGADLETIEAQQQKLLDDNKDLFTKQDADALYKMYGESKVMGAWHDAFEGGAYRGQAPADTAARTGLDRKLTGGTGLNQRLNRVLKKYGQDRVDSVIGQQARDHAFQLSDALEGANKQVADKHLDALSSVIRNHHKTVGGVVGGTVGAGLGAMVGHPLIGATIGSNAGIGAEVVSRRIMQRLATDPKIAGRLAEAVSKNVSPRIAAPLIASMMQKTYPDQNGATQ